MDELSVLSSQTQGGDKSHQTYQSMQRVLGLGVFMQDLPEVIVWWIGCEVKEDKLDCKSDYCGAYIHLDLYYLVSYFRTTEVKLLTRADVS